MCLVHGKHLVFIISSTYFREKGQEEGGIREGETPKPSSPFALSWIAEVLSFLNKGCLFELEDKDSKNCKIQQVIQ